MEYTIPSKCALEISNSEWEPQLPETIIAKIKERYSYVNSQIIEKFKEQINEDPRPN